MAETLNRASDIKKMTGKYIGDEEPIVVAQRFLNIFRQLHIFNAERKDAFNNMILELPPELRGMFGALPGGSVLQEYVDDLEQKAGIKRDKTNINLSSATNSSQLNEEISKARILATALAEAQVQAAANMPQMRPVAPVYNTPTKEQRIANLKSEMNIAKKNNDIAKIKELHQAYNDLQNEPEQATNYVTAPMQNMGASGPVKIVADADFAKEIASAFVEAMQYAEKQRHTETYEITSAIRESQVEMAKILKEQKDTIVSNITTAPIEHSPELLTKSDAKEITQAIKDSQIEIAKIFAQAQHNIPVIKSNGATEVMSRNDNSDIAQAIKDSQLEVAKMLMQHNAISASTSNNANANNIQINNSPTFPPIEEFMNGIVGAQMEMFREVSKVQTQELSSIISLALKESQQLSTQTIIDAVSALQKENAKLFERQLQKPQVIVQERIIREDAPKMTAQPQAKEEQNIDDTSLDEDMSSIEAIEETIAKTKKKKKKKKKNKSNIDNNIFFGDNSQDDEFIFGEDKANTPEIDNNDYEFDYEDEKKLNGNVLLDISLFDSTDNALKNPPKSSSSKISDKLDDSILDIDSDDTHKKDDEFAWLDNDELSSNKNEDWNWNEIEENIDTISSEKTEQKTKVEATDDEDWEWEEVDEEVEPQETVIEVQAKEPEIVIEAKADEATDNEDWEWEEVDEEVEPKETVIGVQAKEPEIVIESKADEATDDEDWEWEEVDEEVEPQETVIGVQAKADEATENEDWEWEYEEEVQETAPIVPVITTATESLSNIEEEWEWEYEEEESVEPSLLDSNVENQTKVQTFDNGEGEEWEWEYEEESSTDTLEAFSSTSEEAEGIEGEEWEWEYEEENHEEISPIITQTNEVAITAQNLTSDPYKNDYVLSSEDKINQNDTIAQIYTGDLYFQKDVFADDSKSNQTNIIDETLNPEIVISELSDSESNNEPYLKNNDIK